MMERRSVLVVVDKVVLSRLGHFLDSDQLVGLVSRRNWRCYFVDGGILQKSGEMSVSHLLQSPPQA